MPDSNGPDTQMTGVSNPPNGGQITSTEGLEPGEESQAQPKAAGGAASPKDSWMQTTQPDLSQGASQIAQQPVKTVPVPITPLKRGGLLGVMDSVADAIVGKQRPELAKDPDGNLYVKQQTLTRGQQWMRIAAEAAHGAAEGLANGKGAGNMGKAAVAGWNAGAGDTEKQKTDAKDMQGQVDAATLTRANTQMQQMKMAELTWQATRNQAKASQEDEDWASKKDVEMEASHAVLLGTTAHAGDISHLLEAHPGLMKSLTGYKGADQDLRFVPNYQDGQAAGFKVYKTRPGFAATVIPDGALFHTFDPATGKTEEHHVTGPITQGEIDAYEMQYFNNKKAFENEQSETELKKQQAAAEKAKASEVPSEIAKNRGEANAANARASVAPSEIDKNKAEAGLADVKTSEAQAMTGQGATGQSLVDAIGTGHVVADRLGYLISKNPELLQAVIAKYPDFDTSKAAGYANLYKEFTSTKQNTAGAALNNGATALKHLKRLEELNTPMSHIPHTSAWTAYQNQLDTAAPELAKFYGDTTIPAIASIKNTLGSTLPGNRAAAFTTQAVSMSKKFDSYEQQWKNGAPSAAYHMPMMQIDDEAKAARAHFDPAFAQRQQEEAAAEKSANDAVAAKMNQPAAAKPPAGAVGTAPDKVTKKLQYVDASGKVLGPAE